jgi:hypothetical protein
MSMPVIKSEVWSGILTSHEGRGERDETKANNTNIDYIGKRQRERTIETYDNGRIQVPHFLIASVKGV